jgi:methionyl-tRNA formyltransferase
MQICFLGSPPTYSQQVKKALIQANYPLIKDPQKADLLVVAAHGNKISPTLLAGAKYGGINIHPSLLPKYRGATPVPHTILAGEKETGTTIIKMAEKIDTGPILAQQKMAIDPQDTAETLLTKLFSLGAEMLISILPDYLDGKLTAKPQPEHSPTPYCKRFTKEDGFVPWKLFLKERTSSGLDRKVRAFFPWPGVSSKLPNEKTLKILPTGMVQLEGKQPITWKQFSAGYSHLLQ